MKKLILTTIIFLVFFNFSNAINYGISHRYYSGHSRSSSSYNSSYDSVVTIKKNDSVFETKYLYSQKNHLSKKELIELINIIQTGFAFLIILILLVCAYALFTGYERKSIYWWLFFLSIVPIVILQLYIEFFLK